MTLACLFTPDRLIEEFHNLLVCWDFHTPQCLEVADSRNGPKNKKHPVRKQPTRKCLVNEKGYSTMHRLGQPDRKATGTQITIPYTCGEQKNISECIASSTYRSRRPHWIAPTDPKTGKGPDDGRLCMILCIALLGAWEIENRGLIDRLVGRCRYTRCNGVVKIVACAGLRGT